MIVAISFEVCSIKGKKNEKLQQAYSYMPWCQYGAWASQLQFR